MNYATPVFVIDTCIGGLSVVRSLHGSGRVGNAVFAADYAVNPLGVRNAAEIADTVRRWLAMAERRSDTAIIACNTLSVHYHQLYAAETPPTGLRQVVTMVDCFTRMVNSEADRLADRKVLVVGTAYTASQSVYADALKGVLPGIHVDTVAATDLERNVARFEPAGSVDRSLGEPGLRKAIEQADVAILACTCFPLVRAEFETRFPGVLFLDPGEYCGELLRPGARQEVMKLHLEVTGDIVAPKQVADFARSYLGSTCVLS